MTPPSQTQPQEIPREVIRKGKNLSQYVEHWFAGKRDKHDLLFADVNIDNFKCQIKCLKCCTVRPFNGTADAGGCWKISTFQNHAKQIHGSKNLNDVSAGNSIQ